MVVMVVPSDDKLSLVELTSAIEVELGSTNVDDESDSEKIIETSVVKSVEDEISEVVFGTFEVVASDIV